MSYHGTLNILFGFNSVCNFLSYCAFHCRLSMLQTAGCLGKNCATRKTGVHFHSDKESLALVTADL